MEEVKIFSNDSIDKEFHEKGFVKFGQIDQNAIKSLKDLSDQLDIPDYVGCDFNCGMNSNIFESRKLMQENLFKILTPFFKNVLLDSKVFSTSFVNKNPSDKFLILAHQDFTFTREPEIPSVMCWIPLCDVDIKNGAIGFIPKSHKLYDYKRAFPFPASYTPIVSNELELMNYLEILDMKAGEMVFFNNLTVHGSFANYENDVRHAINISFTKKEERFYVYVSNPKTKGKTHFKFEVDQHFLVKYNNPTLEEMYNNGSIDIPYPVIEEEAFGEYDNSWQHVKQKLVDQNIKPQSRNKPYVNKFKKYRKKIELKDRIYNSLKKINPLRVEVSSK